MADIKVTVEGPGAERVAQEIQAALCGKYLVELDVCVVGPKAPAGAVEVRWEETVEGYGP